MPFVLVLVLAQEWGQDLTVNQTNFLSCTVLSAAGPFHAICEFCVRPSLAESCHGDKRTAKLGTVPPSVSRTAAHIHASRFCN